jgi:hypothetical protein
LGIGALHQGGKLGTLVGRGKLMKNRQIFRE